MAAIFAALSGAPRSTALVPCNTSLKYGFRTRSHTTSLARVQRTKVSNTKHAIRQPHIVWHACMRSH
eukprot:4394089-Prymnesium_polylepis.1